MQFTDVFLHIFCFFAFKYLDFCKFAICFQIVEVEPKGFPKRYQNDQQAVDVIVDQKLELYFNLTNPQRISIPSCPSMTIYSTTLKGVMISLEPQASMVCFLL